MKYVKKQQLGEKGRDGRTFLVIDKFNCEYAMKTFRANKSSAKILEEVSLQRKCSDLGISPKIVDFDIDKKYIVMEKMDMHLVDYMKTAKGNLPNLIQKRLIHIFKQMDKAKVFHADANILNYMLKDNKLYIIDFGMGKEITPALTKKVKSANPNSELMLLGFILKLKDMSAPPQSYSLLKSHLPIDFLHKYNL